MFESIKAVLGSSIVFIYCGAAWSQTQEKTTQIKPAFVLDGAKSKIDKKQFARIENGADLRTIWTKHLVGDLRMAEYDQLSVDFEKFEVFCVFLGKGITARGIDIVQIIEEADCCRIRCEVPYFSSGVGHPGFSPWLVTAIPRTSKRVSLEFARRETKNGPITEWEKAREWKNKTGK